MTMTISGSTGLTFPNDTTQTTAFTNASPTFTGTVSVEALTASGNLTFSSTGQRILGDFSNATVANRVAFQTSTTNGNTTVFAIPNGTGTTAGFFANNDPTLAGASSEGSLSVNGTTDVRLASAIRPGGTYLPLTMYTGGSERLRIDTSGNVGIGTSSPTLTSANRTVVSINGSSTSLLSLNSSNATKSYLYNDGTNLTVSCFGTTLFNTGASDLERMRIDSSGNVGIGTSSPGAKLDVNDASSTGNATLIRAYEPNLLDGVTGARIVYGLGSSWNAGFAFTPNYATPASSMSHWQVNGTTLATLNGSGNLGIGTSSPSGKLDVYTASNTDAYVRGGNAVRLFLSASSYDWKIASNYYLTGGLQFTQGGTTQGRFDESGNFGFNSGYGSAATAYGCRAWVNFNGTGTVAIRSSGNVSSITDRATGQYTVNFTSAMPDANYAAFVCLENNSYGGDDSNTTTTYWYMATRTNGTVADNDSISVAFFR